MRHPLQGRCKLAQIHFGWRFELETVCEYTPPLSEMPTGPIFQALLIFVHRSEAPIAPRSCARTTKPAKTSLYSGYIPANAVSKSRFFRSELQTRVDKPKEDKFSDDSKEKDRQIGDAGAKAGAALRDAIANQHAAELGIELANAKTRQAQAEKQLELVRKKQEPRGVPFGPIMLTKDALHQRLVVQYQDGPPEIKLFTDVLCEALRLANWQISGPKAIPSTAAKGAGNSEITILWPSGRNPDPAFDVLSGAFREAGWSVSGSANNEVYLQTLVVLIGPR